MDDTEIRQRAVKNIIRGVATKTGFIVIVAALAALVYVFLQNGARRWWFLPLSVVSGGALGLLNFRWLASSVEKIYLRKGATPGVSNLAAAIISILKLSVIFIVLFIVIKWQLLHIFGLVAGLSLCFLAILWEGATIMKKTLMNGDT